MIQNPQIGVVVPTRNSAATLDWTLLTLSSQRGVDVVAVVVDSDSTDGTLAICRRWGVEVLSEPPGNMYRAINKGMRALLHAPWLAYLNSDDLVYSDGYARLVAAAIAHGADVAYGDGDFVDEHGAFVRTQVSFGPGLVRRQLAAGTLPFIQPASLFRREVFERLNGFDVRFTCVADYDFFARAAAAGFGFAKSTGGPVAAFRVHERQLSTAQKQTVQREQRLRRRECGRHKAVARRSLSTIWKLRNTINSLAGLVRVERTREMAAASGGGGRWGDRR